MKNITISVDEETYRQARIIAAQRDASVSALVRGFLVSLTDTEAPVRDPVREQEDLLKRIASRHPGFKASDRLSREALYERS